MHEDARIRNHESLASGRLNVSTIILGICILAGCILHAVLPNRITIQLQGAGYGPQGHIPIVLRHEGSSGGAVSLTVSNGRMDSFKVRNQ
jgi:hypothetical protein